MQLVLSSKSYLSGKHEIYNIQILGIIKRKQIKSYSY
jgi:hypothetical protein